MYIYLYCTERIEPHRCAGSKRGEVAEVRRTEAQRPVHEWEGQPFV